MPGEGESFSGLEVDGMGVVPVEVVEDDRGGEESDGESIPRGARTFTRVIHHWQDTLSMQKKRQKLKCFLTKENRKGAVGFSFDKKLNHPQCNFDFVTIHLY